MRKLTPVLSVPARPLTPISQRGRSWAGLLRARRLLTEGQEGCVAGGAPVAGTLPRGCPLASRRNASMPSPPLPPDRGNPLGLPGALPAIPRPVPLQACMTTMFQCVHFWGWKALENSPGRSNTSAAEEMTVFQMMLCSIPVRRLRAWACWRATWGLGLWVTAAIDLSPMTMCSPSRCEASRPAWSNREITQAAYPHVF